MVTTVLESCTVRLSESFGRQEMNKSASELPPFFVVDDELPLAELPRLYPLLTAATALLCRFTELFSAVSSLRWSLDTPCVSWFGHRTALSATKPQTHSCCRAEAKGEYSEYRCAHSLRQAHSAV